MDPVSGWAGLGMNRYHSTMFKNRFRPNPNLLLPVCRQFTRTRSSFRLTRLFFYSLVICVSLIMQSGVALLRAQETSATTTHTVVAGDSLSALADRFGVELDELQRVNGITNPNLLEVGQVLIIPGSGPVSSQIASGLPTVRAVPGDTLARIAARTGVQTETLGALNDLEESARLFPGQPIYLPAERAASAAPQLRFGAVIWANIPSTLRQGQTGRITVETRRPVALEATWNGLPIHFTERGGNPLRQTAMIPVPALIAPGPYDLVLRYTALNGRTLTRTWAITVSDGGYDSQVINLPPDRGALLEPTLVQEEAAKVTAVWSHTSPHLLWNEPFIRPIGAEYPTTSPFGTRRAYNAGPFSDYHAGQDFGAPTGVPILVPGSGIVALAEPLTVRGNAVIIDHGRGIFSGYWHLHEINVEVGMPVQTGDIMGTVGNTGLSTGAHLHWELRIYGVAVDPMQFLEESFLD